MNKVALRVVALLVLVVAGLLIAVLSRSPTGSETSGKAPRFALVPKSIGHPYWEGVREGMLEAAGRLGVQAVFQGPPEASIEEQLKIIESLIAQGYDGIAISPNDPALKAALPTPDPEAQFPNCPLNALLKPDLTPQEQTGIIGQMLIDYWTTTRTLPNGTWEETCAQLAGKNRAQLALVPPGHPALGKDGFIAGKDHPGIRLHVIGSSNCVFQLIYNGPDGKPYTDDDQIRNFPPDAEVK